MKAIVRLHKSLIAAAIGLFVFLFLWAASGTPPRTALAAASGTAVFGLTVYWRRVIRIKYG